MYLKHCELDRYPFALTPNLQFFCNLPGHQAALNVLLFSLESGEGFIKIIGEVGSGKTLLCRKLLDTLGDNFVTAYIPNPDLDSQSLRKSLARELGIEFQSDIDQSVLLQLISEKLLSLRAENKQVVLIVDEAQSLPDESLEALRLLTNLETESEKLLQIVLFGQTELDMRLSQHRFRQLRQRFTFSHKLLPLAREEMTSYLSHRLVIAGYTKGSLFDSCANELLFKATNGLPRVINILCHKAMLIAYGRGEKRVNRDSVNIAIKDSPELAFKQSRCWKIMLIGLGAFVGLSFFGVIYYRYLGYLFGF